MNFWLCTFSLTVPAIGSRFQSHLDLSTSLKKTIALSTSYKFDQEYVFRENLGNCWRKLAASSQPLTKHDKTIQSQYLSKNMLHRFCKFLSWFHHDRYKRPKNGPAIHGDGNPPSQRLEVALPLCTFQGIAGGGWAHRRLEMMHPFSERRNEIPKGVFIVWSMSHYLWLYKKQPQPTSNGFSFWNILGSFPLLSHRGAFCLVFQSRQYVGQWLNIQPPAVTWLFIFNTACTQPAAISLIRNRARKNLLRFKNEFHWQLGSWGRHPPRCNWARPIAPPPAEENRHCSSTRHKQSFASHEMYPAW